ncbi:MAG: TAT-variant-translocated molybdopterin oxidoreductase [Chitinophagaceae bacterium]|nr:TAT-variant-translocated molybdopterin oxidoreductase [Chitinophagaceae bacterium]MCW5929306.1 TAT-variant-translocated molybdopterin oxidoreductase [Chitinophagaceae bacterium]
MEQKKYWQNLGELNNTEGYQKLLNDEFQEDLPLVEDRKGLLDAKAPRRDFLKYVGFSTAAAAIAAGCEMPVRKSIPYLNKPESLTPGEAQYYATTYTAEGEVVPLVAKVRDGRPIKVDGNPDSLLTGNSGGSSARVQASVLDLYDTARLRYPVEMVNGEPKEVPLFDAIDKKIAGEIGGNVVLLTSTVNSPSTKQVISEFFAKFPAGRHVQYDAISYSGILEANQASYGKRAIPSYHFDKAKVIIGLDADFLGTWLSSEEFATQYAAGRKIDDANLQMSKHIQFEGILSLTGANADDRFLHKPSESGAVALNILAKLGGNVSAPALQDEKLKKGIDMAVSFINSNKGASLVVSGSNDPAVQVVVNAINELAGSNGTTISWSNPAQTKLGVDSEMAQLVADMKSGSVQTLLIQEANPAYNYPDAEGFKEGLAKVKLSVSFNDRADETSALCNYIIPHHHYLESWGDAEGRTAFISFQQPTISPLFKTRYFQTSLLKWSGNNTDYEDYFRNYWITKLGSESALDQALQNGIMEPAAETITAAPYSDAGLAEAASKAGALKGGEGLEVVLYQKVSLGSGAAANNPWLQEMPDPISRATWDNYAMISYDLAKELNIKLDDHYEVEVHKPVVEFTIDGKVVELPILAIPGMHPRVIAIAVGYGRSEGAGIAANAVGYNAYPLVKIEGGNRKYVNEASAYKKLSGTYDIAYTQTHNQYEGRKEVVKEYSLADYKKNPDHIVHEREHLAKDFAPKTHNFRDDATLYPVYEFPGAHWGMSIDLNACMGCGACTIACTAENNVSVVGKSEVLRAHEMHWLRIDRYYASYRDNTEGDNLNVVFMPMLCQHCDNAPCENVCPVSATNHSTEGLNQMAYNRCIGTRYCANNCPYKVRRFNWADYTGADSFGDNQKTTGVGKLDPAVFQMNEDLTRMVLNPDVTVRSRGVIEKCSFCVQRLQDAKLKAKKENDPSLIRDVKTACMQACSTNAIVFGNVNDKESRIYKVRNEEQKRRTYYALEMIHVLPNVSYLAKIRNTDRPVGVVNGSHANEAAAAENAHG